MPRTSLLRVDEDRDLGGVHVGQVGAERLGHPDRLPVVLLDRRGRAPGDPRRVLRHHRVVVGEAACREHDAACAPESSSRLPYWRARMPTTLPSDSTIKRLHPHVVQRPHASRRGGLDERLHQHVAGAGFALLLVRHLRDVAARSGGGDRVERVGVFAAAVHQALVAHRLPAGLGEELRLERHAALAPASRSGRRCRRSSRRSAFSSAPGPIATLRKAAMLSTESVEATSLLQRRAAAEVDEPAGHRRRAAPGPVRSRTRTSAPAAGRLDRCGGAGDAVAGDHDVGLVVPAS